MSTPNSNNPASNVGEDILNSHYLPQAATVERQPTTLVRPLTAPVNNTLYNRKRPLTSPNIRATSKYRSKKTAAGKSSHRLYTPISDRNQFVRLQTQVIIGDVVSLKQQEKYIKKESIRNHSNTNSIILVDPQPSLSLTTPEITSTTVSHFNMPILQKAIFDILT